MWTVAALEALWPASFTDPAQNETTYMVAAPVADSVDVLTDAAAPALFAPYAAPNSTLGIAPGGPRLIRVGAPAGYGPLLEWLSSALPFAVTGSAGVQFGSLPNGHWVVTLMNHHGLEKQPRTAPTVVAGQGRLMTVLPNQGTIVNVSARSCAQLPVLMGNQVQVPIEQGGVCVLELELR